MNIYSPYFRESNRKKQNFITSIISETITMGVSLWATLYIFDRISKSYYKIVYISCLNTYK